MMATARQKAYALSLLGQLGYSVRYINKDYKALGLGMRERTGKVTDWLDSLNAAEADRLIKRLRTLQQEAPGNLDGWEEVDEASESLEAEKAVAAAPPVTLDTLLQQVCELEVRIGRQGELRLALEAQLQKLRKDCLNFASECSRAIRAAQTRARRADELAAHVRVKHNYHVLRTTDPKDIAPGWSRRAREDQLTWAKKRRWPF
jgi:chromosome segregation ATPase